MTLEDAPKRPRGESEVQRMRVFAVRWSIRVTIDNFDGSDYFETEDESTEHEDDVRDALEIHDNGQPKHLYASKASALEAMKKRFDELIDRHWKPNWGFDDEQPDSDGPLEWCDEFTNECFYEDSFVYLVGLALGLKKTKSSQTLTPASSRCLVTCGPASKRLTSYRNPYLVLYT